MNKKALTVVAVSIAILLALPGVAFGRSYYQQKTGAFATCKAASAYACAYLKEARYYFYDADGDGICDNRGTGLGGGRGYIDTDGDGVCDNRFEGLWGQGYIDENGDGICDNYGTQSQGQSQRQDSSGQPNTSRDVNNADADGYGSGYSQGYGGHGHGQGHGSKSCNQGYCCDVCDSYHQRGYCYAR